MEEIKSIFHIPSAQYFSYSIFSFDFEHRSATLLHIKILSEIKLPFFLLTQNRILLKLSKAVQ